MRHLILAALIAAPACAETIAVATAPNGAAIELTSEKGPCLADAMLAWWISPDAKERIPGCYLLMPHGATVSFLDGERADIPAQMLKRPTSM